MLLLEEAAGEFHQFPVKDDGLPAGVLRKPLEDLFQPRQDLPHPGKGVPFQEVPFGTPIARRVRAGLKGLDLFEGEVMEELHFQADVIRPFILCALGIAQPEVIVEQDELLHDDLPVLSPCALDQWTGRAAGPGLEETDELHLHLLFHHRAGQTQGLPVPLFQGERIGEFGRQGFEGFEKLPVLRLPAERFVRVPEDLCEDRIQATPVRGTFLRLRAEGFGLNVFHRSYALVCFSASLSSVAGSVVKGSNILAHSLAIRMSINSDLPPPRTLSISVFIVSSAFSTSGPKRYRR
jgi:hypothetical protein